MLLRFQIKYSKPMGLIHKRFLITVISDCLRLQIIHIQNIQYIYNLLNIITIHLLLLTKHILNNYVNK